MLKSYITHPVLISQLAKAGHGTRILLTDSNYAVDAFAPQNAKRVYLNFAPGLLSMPDIIKGLSTAIPIEEALGVLQDDGEQPPIAQVYRDLLPDGVNLEQINRHKFYDIAQQSRTTLVIATGETSLYANLLLTVGFIKQDGTPNH